MARPFKQGLHYFPLDVNFFEDERIQDLNLSYGYLGEIVYLRLLTMVYANGYFLEKTTTSLAKTIIRSIGPNFAPSLSEIEAIIETCAELGLLDQALLKEGVITSKAIQKQFVLSTRRRRHKVERKYWLLDEETMSQLAKFPHFNEDTSKELLSTITPLLEVNVDNNPISVDDNRVIVDKSTQKEKEKEKETKRLIKDVIDKGALAPSSNHFLTKVLIKNKYIDEHSLESYRFNHLFLELLEAYDFEDVLAALDYLVKYSRKKDVVIRDKFAFLKESLYQNLEMFERKREIANESFEVWFKRNFLQVDR